MLKRNPYFLKTFGLAATIAFFSVSAKGQKGFSASYDYGQIIIHTPKLDGIRKGPVTGFTLNYYFPNQKGEAWRQYYNYPNYGICYNFNSFGNNDVLGQSHSANAFIQIPFFRKRDHFDLGLKSFVGLGYFNNRYDVETNPTNLAISTRLNISAEMGLYTRVRFSPLYFEYSIGLNHLSNGLISSPNLGINNLKNRFGLGIELEEQHIAGPRPEPDRSAFIKNEIWAYFAGGVKEIRETDKKYAVFNFSMNYSRQVSPINKLGIGLDVMKDNALTDLGIYRYGYTGNGDLSVRYGPNLHIEFIMDHFHPFFAYGLYLGDATYYSRPDYYKAGFKFIFGDFSGITLIRATPKFRADVVEFGLGYSFQK